MSKVVLEGYILVPDADLHAVEQELPSHIKLTREEEGCLVFKVLQDEENINRFNVYEEFASQNSFELHQQRVRHSKWGAIAINVERRYRIEGAL
ncbi:MAG: antibiotic biosynthesis monooxygenase [Motiliproteus sp.]